MVDKAGATSEHSEPNQKTPEMLVKDGNKLINAGNYEKAIQIMSQALQIAIKEANDEVDPSLAKYYYSYGDAIIAKLTDFNEKDDEGELIEKTKELKLVEVEEEKKGTVVLIDEKDTEENTPEKDSTEDIEVAWESMETAKAICEEQLTQTTLSEKAKKEVTKMLGRIYLSIGQLFSMRDKKKEALMEYFKALNVIKKVEDENSRELAEVYFTIGSLIMTIQGKEKEAVANLFEAAHILENCLYKQLEKPIKAKGEEAKIDRELVESHATDKKEVKDLKEVLSGVYDKIEDAFNPLGKIKENNQ